MAGQAISDLRGFLIVAGVRIDLEAGFSRGRMRVECFHARPRFPAPEDEVFRGPVHGEHYDHSKVNATDSVSPISVICKTYVIFPPKR